MKRVFLSIVLCGTLCSAQTQDFKKAPNSYIYDTGLASTNNYGGIYIPVKKAYDMWAGYEYLRTDAVAAPVPQGTQSVSLFWEDSPGLISEVFLIPGADPASSKIKVSVNSSGKKGNAVIAFRVDGTVYWSWHIWVTDNPENGVEFTHGYETDSGLNPITIKYMDRNLGALASSFTGNDWDKSGGLMYEWGRKDPFPALVNKDGFFYELSTESGTLKHKSIDRTNTIPVKLRAFNEIEKNIQDAVKNPLTYIINSDAGQWFSSSKYKVAGSTAAATVAWDLWADNAKGTNGNVNSSNTAVKNESRSYELKSEMDPCPNGWRVPSYYGRVTVNNNLSPFGRKNSGVNDDVSDYSKLKPDVANAALTGIKVYPGLGMDFTNAQNGARNLGLLPITGGYVYYPNAVSPNAAPGVVYQDQNANGGLWSATYASDGARVFSYISDHARTTTSVGLHAVYINQTNPTKSGNAVRCMKDPNLTKIGDFSTEYFTNEKENFSDGLTSPNSFIISNETEIRIPVSKAFAVHSQYFSDGELLPADQLAAKVLWTTNQTMVKNVSLNINPQDAKKSEIVVKIDPQQKGNAVISLHNGDTRNPAYWSWHIWAPQTSPVENPVKYTTESTIPVQYNFVNPTKSQFPPITTEFMTMNLGAMQKFTPSTAAVAKGLHYQWGRKDPIPSFPLNDEGSVAKIYLGSENASRTGTLTFTEMTKLGYEASHTVPYAEYGSNRTQKKVKLRENLKYAAQNPLKFLYHNGTGTVFDGGNKANNNLSNVRDWVSGERSQLPDRWGHASGKSVFDPCPAGWCVPDVSFTNLYAGSKGTSPWYNGYSNDMYGKSGVIQDQWHSVQAYYQGTSGDGGWQFEGPSYKIGSFAKDGIRGETGEKTVNYEKAGVWTASLADYGTGFGIAMQFEGVKMQTGTGVYPQAGMGVRCVKYSGPETVAPPSQYIPPVVPEPASTKISESLTYPNPFNNDINVKALYPVSYEIYGMSGKLLKQGYVSNQKIFAGDLKRGNYILKVKLKSGEEFIQRIMKD